MKEKRKIDSFLGADVEFKGKLKFSGTLRIDGHVKGEIWAEGSLFVGEGASVRSHIHASSVQVSGELHGNIVADHRIEILSPGKVVGDIQAPVLLMEKGGALQGRVRVRREKGEDESASEPFAADEDMEASDPTLGVIQGIVMRSPHQVNDTSKDGSALVEETGTCRPLQDAEVVAVCGTSLRKRTQTDASGYYELTALEQGIWKLNVMSKGHEVAEATVEILAGGVYEQNFV